MRHVFARALYLNVHTSYCSFAQKPDIVLVSRLTPKNQQNAFCLKDTVQLLAEK